MGSVMARPSQLRSEHGIGRHDGKAAEAKGDKNKIEHGGHSELR